MTPAGSLHPGMMSNGAIELTAAQKESTESTDDMTFDSVTVISFEWLTNRPPEKQISVLMSNKSINIVRSTNGFYSGF